MPTYEDNPTLPASPPGSKIPIEGEEVEDDVPPPKPHQPPLAQGAPFMITQESWDQMQARLTSFDNRLGTIEQRLGHHETSMLEMTRSLQNMDVKHDLFYDEMGTFFRDMRNRYPALGPSQ